jgi:hypothetical protein
MKGWFARVGSTGFLVPACKASSEIVGRLGAGEGLVMSVKKVRSLSWHNMYFGCCRAIGQNCEPERDEDSIDAELRIRAGHFDVMFVEGHEIRVPKRIAFDKLSADEWANLWRKLDYAMQEGFGFDFEAWKRRAA